MNLQNMIDTIPKFGMFITIINNYVMIMRLMLINVEIIYLLISPSVKLECITEEIIAGKFTII